MTYNKAREYIAGFSQGGGKVSDLSRIKALLSAMGNPQDKLKFVHIAGTNGKGSVTTMLDSVFMQAGLKSGKFISPYILEFCDRIQINGEWIEQNRLAQLTEYVSGYAKPLIEGGAQFSQFEIITAIAFEYFAHEKVDIVCLETGIGGTLDCTNVIKSPLCAVITSIGYDHVSILGNTIGEIAAQKAGIIKEGTAVVSAPGQDEQALEQILLACAKTGSTLYMPNRSGVKVISSSIKGTKFFYGDEQYTIAMAGEHQVINALCALECIKVLTMKGINIPIEAVKDGLARAQICARGEAIGENPLIILDGAHNPSGMEAAKSLLSAGNAPRVGMLGMLKDKLVEKSLSVILPALDGVVFVDGYAQREMAADELVELAKAYGIEVYSMPFSEKAMELAKSLAGENGTVLVAGSLYLASAVKSMQKNKKK